MKNLSLITVICLLCSATLLSQEQKKIGIFLHGFQGNADKWIVESGAPDAWKGDIIDDYIALSYETNQLTEENLPALIGEFVNQMDSLGYNRTNDQWVLIGHSLGGILAREFYPALRRFNFNVAAVISIAGPSQGARATAVNSDDIEDKLNDMKDKMEAALEHERPYIGFFVDFLDALEGTSNAQRIDSIPNYIATVRDSILGYVDHIERENADDIIGVGGSLINRINSYSETSLLDHPQNFISVIGAEKDKAPIRMAGGVYTSLPDLQDEAELIEQVQLLRNDYFSRHEGYYRGLYNRYYAGYVTCQFFTLGFGCDGSSYKFARKRMEIWQAAKLEIDNLGKTWSELIDSYKIEKRWRREYVPYCGEIEGDDTFPGRGGFFDIEYLPNGDICSSNTNGEYIMVEYDLLVPDKNDGVVNIHSVLWSKGDAFGDANNIFMSDEPHDGGYNHFEIRNYRRAYSLPSSNGKPGFSEESVNPAMLEVETWIRRNL